MESYRPRRSILYMPGSNTRAMEKAQNLPADGYIFDLEDSVAPSAKETARTQIITSLATHDYGARERVVRINSLTTAWGYADCVAVAGSAADAVLIPKVESADSVRQVAQILDDCAAPAQMAIWCMIETPRGVLDVREIASAGGRICCLVMGTSDLAKDLYAEHTPDRIPFLTGLGLCLLAARAARIAILDGVHLDLSDDEGFERSCKQGKQLGFDGKTLIHPKTIIPCNRIFSPSEEEVVQANRLIEAHGNAVAAGEGIILLDGKLVENLHVENARRILRIAGAMP